MSGRCLPFLGGILFIKRTPSISNVNVMPLSLERFCYPIAPSNSEEYSIRGCADRLGSAGRDASPMDRVAEDV